MLVVLLHWIDIDLSVVVYTRVLSKAVTNKNKKLREKKISGSACFLLPGLCRLQLVIIV